MAEVLTLTEQLEAELPQMLAEHQAIVAALNKLREAAARAGRSEIVAFAEALVEHARTEEEVMYPAAVPARGPRLAGIVGPGQSFGEPVMFLERPTVVDAQAASDALLLHLPKAAIFDEIASATRSSRVA